MKPPTCVALAPGSKGGTRLPVWDAVGCKPEGLPEVAAVEVVGSEACLSVLPYSPPAAHGARSLFGEAAALEPLEPTAPVPTHPVGSQPRSRTVSSRFGRSQELPVASSGALRRRRVPG
jgi:hypothetical protein